MTQLALTQLVDGYLRQFPSTLCDPTDDGGFLFQPERDVCITAEWLDDSDEIVLYADAGIMCDALDSEETEIARTLGTDEDGHWMLYIDTATRFTSLALHIPISLSGPLEFARAMRSFMAIFDAWKAYLSRTSGDDGLIPPSSFRPETINLA